jgi:hypothetical protein
MRGTRTRGSSSRCQELESRRTLSKLYSDGVLKTDCLGLLLSGFNIVLHNALLQHFTSVMPSNHGDGHGKAATLAANGSDTVSCQTSLMLGASTIPTADSYSCQNLYHRLTIDLLLVPN